MSETNRIQEIIQARKRKFRIKFIRYATVGFLFWLLGAYLYHFHLDTGLTEKDIEKFQDRFTDKCEELDQELTKFIQLLDKEESEQDQFALSRRMRERTGFDYFVYSKDTLRLWSSNQVPVPSRLSKALIYSEVNFLSNGWYRLSSFQRKDKVYVASFLIKTQYKHENKDLVNEFSDELIGNFDGNLSLNDDGYLIKNPAGEVIFSIVPSEETEKKVGLEFFIFICYLLAAVILLQLFINAFQRLLKNLPILLIIFPAILVFLRYFWLKSGWTGPFASFELFNPELFAASDLVPSLGDLIINVAIFYFMVHFLLKRTRNWFRRGNRKLKLVFFVVPLFLVSFFVAFWINDVIYSLVYHSKMSFDLERLFELDIYSFISVAIIGASFYAYFRLVQYIIIQLKKSDFEWNRLAFLWVITSAAYIIFDQIYYNPSFLTSLWPIFMSGSLLWFQYKEKDYKFVHVISMVAFIAFYAAYILRGYSTQNEEEIRMTQAEKIAKDKDPITEYDYHSIEKKLQRDEFLIPYFKKDFNHAVFSEDLESSYFKKLKDDYDLVFYLFNSEKKLVKDFRNYHVKNYDRLQDIIHFSGTVSETNPNIYFIKDYTDKLTYIAEMPVLRNDSLYGYFFTEMRSKKFPEDIGLPSLLLEEGATTFDQFKNYSIAKYVEGKLVTRKGEYTYPIVSADWFSVDDKFVNRDGYSHYVYQEGGYTTIISKPLSSNLALFTSFSYLLIIFGVLLLIPLGYKQFKNKITFQNIKLNVKIQTLLIGSILITLIAFAVGAGTYVEGQYHESNKGFMKEKLVSVKTELEGKLKEEGPLKKDLSPYLEYLLKKFSAVFATDINVYNLMGDMLASSQPKIYSKGLIANKMNTIAFEEVHLDNKSEYIHEETIGKLNYLSAYTPFFNQRGELLGYLNVQYISRQDKLETQISGFLLAIINIMVLMLAFSTIIAITLSNRLTRPLKYIQDSLKGIQFGSRSKPIEYEGTDEIGELVREYNRKVEELQRNAEALAKSERESAWREMAKQVAHEIKNPLTPMKLSIQHLKRSINVADEDSAAKLERVTKSLIEQIDALTKIANEFSNFAKMPKANETEVDLTEILQNTVAVFSENEKANVSLDISNCDSAVIWADKDLLLRVFNNLIKNAIQAIPADQDGKVKVDLTFNQGRYLVAVNDNGSGISDEEKEKIFVPYFTTKSKGTGLGLAMSKQIVESMKGEIWFESSVGLGTTFYVSFGQFNTDK